MNSVLQFARFQFKNAQRFFVMVLLLGAAVGCGDVPMLQPGTYLVEYTVVATECELQDFYPELMTIEETSAGVRVWTVREDNPSHVLLTYSGAREGQAIVVRQSIPTGPATQLDSELVLKARGGMGLRGTLVAVITDSVSFTTCQVQLQVDGTRTDS